MMVLNYDDLEHNKAYFVSYGINTQLIGRFKSEDECNLHFYDLIHYWNGYGTFKSANDFCVKSGILELRRASKPEIHNLIRFEIENDLI